MPEAGGGRSSRQLALKAISSIAGLALAAVLLYFSLRGVRWPEVGTLIRGAKPHYVAFICALASGSYFLRAIRWRVLLNSEGNVTIPGAFWATAVGYFGNNFLPARAGELVRTVMISSRYALSKTFVLTTALTERVADALALVLISASVLLLYPFQSGWLATSVRPIAALAFAGALAIAVVPLFEPLWHSLLRLMPLPDGIRSKLTHVLSQAMVGLRAFHNPGRLLAFVALTIVIWFLDAYLVVLGGGALGIRVPPQAAFLLIAGLGLGSALPSTPGYVGIYQFVAVSVLVPFGVSRTAAIAYIVFAQALSYMLITFWAGIGFWRHRGTIAASRASTGGGN
jgi:uncharacterized protein (TIRG00374 family)